MPLLGFRFEMHFMLIMSKRLTTLGMPVMWLYYLKILENIIRTRLIRNFAKPDEDCKPFSSEEGHNETTNESTVS